MLSSMAVYGQNTLRPNLHFQNQNLNYYNPAAGFNNDETKSALSLYGKTKVVQENVVWEKPMTVFANYLSRLKNGQGFYSVGLIQDQYSFYNRRTLYAGYTRQRTVFNTRTLSFGARAVLNFDRIRWDDAPQFGKTGNGGRFTPDLDLGAQYQGKRLRVGLGIKNALGNSSRLDGARLLTNQREAYLNLSYTLNFGENFALSPYTLVQFDRNTDLDVGAYVSLYRRVNVSYMLRAFELRSIFTVEANLTRNLHAGFAIDNSNLYRDTNLDFLIGLNF